MIQTYSGYPAIDFVGIVDWTGGGYISAPIRFFVDIACIKGAGILLSNSKGANMKIEAVRG